MGFDLKDLISASAIIIGWVATGTVIWTKNVSRINGLGARTKKVEEGCSSATSRVEVVERSIIEIRRDMQDASNRLGRLEKGIDNIHDTVREGNLAIGVQLNDLSKAIAASDKNLGEGITRAATNIENLQKEMDRLRK